MAGSEVGVMMHGFASSASAHVRRKIGFHPS